MQPGLLFLRFLAVLLTESPHLGIWLEIERAVAVDVLLRVTSYDAATRTFTTNRGVVYTETDMPVEMCRRKIREAMIRQEVFEEIVLAATGSEPL